MGVVAGHAGTGSVGRAILTELDATASVMAPDEFRSLLKAAAVPAFVPLGHPESAATFGLRAAGEILARYLADEE